MRRDAFEAFASLVILALGLLSCVWQPEPQIQASLGRTAIYEQQVEEGLGHLDRLPTK